MGYDLDNQDPLGDDTRPPNLPADATIPAPPHIKRGLIHGMKLDHRGRRLLTCIYDPVSMSGGAYCHRTRRWHLVSPLSSDEFEHRIADWFAALTIRVDREDGVSSCLQ